MEQVQADINNNNNNNIESTDSLACIVKHNSINGQIYNPLCKLCTSPFRKEAEKMAEEGHIHTKIKIFLDSKGENIALQNVKNHIQRHFFGEMEKITLEDYRQNLNELSQHRENRFALIEKTIDIGKMEVAKCMSMPTSTDPLIEKERQKMLLEAGRFMREGVVMLNDMEDEEKKVRALMDRFYQAWNVGLSNAKTDAEKVIFKNAIAEFRKAFSTVVE